jgi:hypothetical protein
MTRRSAPRAAAIAAALLLYGCPGDSDSDENGGGSADDGGSAHEGGSSAEAGRAGGGSGASGHAGSAGSAGSAGVAGARAGSGGDASGGRSGSDCPDTIPGLCRVCADDRCGEPVCVNGAWRFACPEDADGGMASEADGGASSALRWYTTCGDPVCGISDDPFDDPSIPNCENEQAGDACSDEGAECDGVASCGAVLRCTDRDPTMQPGGCPISRARYKQDIAYLNGQQLRSYHDQVVHMPLASWRYRSAPEAGPQLGFIIEDIEPSVAASGDRVNLYGYLSMAVAAIQVQQEQIRALSDELHALRTQLGDADTAAPVCQP